MSFQIVISRNSNFTIRNHFGVPTLTPLLVRKAAEHMQLITINYDNLAQIHATHEFTEPTVLTDYPAVFDVHM